MHGLAEALGHDDRRVQKFTFIGGVLGLLGGFALCYWTSVIDYPLNIGGRPYNSWPAFIVIVFECTILFAALSAVIGMLVLNGLPQPYHPVFNVPQFSRASQDRWFLVVHASDPRFDARATMDKLQASHPLSVAEVPE